MEHKTPHLVATANVSLWITAGLAVLLLYTPSWSVVATNGKTMRAGLLQGCISNQTMDFCEWFNIEDKDSAWITACQILWGGGTMLVILCAALSTFQNCPSCKASEYDRKISISAFFAGSAFTVAVITYGAVFFLRAKGLYDIAYFSWGYYAAIGTVVSAFVIGGIMRCTTQTETEVGYKRLNETETVS